MQLKTWTHPRTGEQRIYINNAMYQNGSKMWVEKTEANSFGDDWVVKCFVDWSMDTRKAKDEASNAIEEKFGRCTFNQLLEKVNG